MKRFFVAAAFVFAGILASILPLAAQQPPGAGRNNGGNNGQQNNGEGRKLSFPLWKAELPGGNYIVARNAINAVSSQQYILDGVARVTEVNVSTTGNFFPRFYYLEMLPVNVPANVPGAQLAADHAQAAAEEGTKEGAPEVWSKVVKNYPATTHAATIEFRLESAEQLQKLYESVERVWLTGVSEVYTPTGVHSYDPGKEIKNANDSSGSGGAGAAGSGTN